VGRHEAGQEPPPEAQRLIVLGRFGRVHGVRGWLRLHSYTEPRDELLRYKDCLVGRDGEWRQARFAEGQAHGSTLIGRLQGVEDRETAAGLTGADIAVTRSELPEPADGHYYWADLEGLTVRNRDGRLLGRVSHLLATGAHDVLVVQGERETLIPFVMKEVIIGVDFGTRIIDVDWEWD